VRSVWRPLRGPVQDWPLALCDSRTVSAEDLHPGDLVYDDYVVEKVLIHYNQKQKWYYLSYQSPDEAWVFIQSDTDNTRDKGGVPHSSFPIPPHGKSIMPRESVEVRCLVFV
jgi:hypothetical protein